MPYAIRLSGAEPRVFWEDGAGSRRHAFSLKGAAALTDLMLTRKMRNNGVGRQLTARLLSTGHCSMYFRDQNGDCYGFAWTRSASGHGAYELRLVGDYPHPLLRALNRTQSESLALAEHRRRKELRRSARRSVSHIRRKSSVQRTIVGDNGRLQQHFKNTPLTWAGTLRLIARATCMPVHNVEDRLLNGMLERGAAALRVTVTFVVRVNLDAPFTGSVPAAHPVTLWSTKDNRHPVYRRLRKALRQLRTGGVVYHRAVGRRARREARRLMRQAA